MNAIVAPEILRAGTEHVPILAEVARRTFLDAYREFVDPADMTAYLDSSFAPAIVAGEVADPDNLFLLARLGGAYVGYSKLHFGPPHESVTGEEWQPAAKLWRIYVDASVYRHGVGSVLLASTFDAARDRGARSIWLTTNIHNARAISFYEKWGFTVVGDAKFTLGQAVHEDHVFARTI